MLEKSLRVTKEAQLIFVLVEYLRLCTPWKCNSVVNIFRPFFLPLGLLPASDEEQKNCCYSKTTLIANHQIRQKLSNLQHHHALQRNTRLAATPSSADSSSSLPRRAFTSTTTTRSNWHSTSFSLGHAHFSWAALLLLALFSHMPRPCLGSPLPLFAEVAPPSYANTPHSLGAMSNKTSDDADEYSQNSNSELLGVAKPKWMDPCGLSSARSHLAPPLAMASGGVAIEPLSESELVRNVVLAAKHALAHSRFFRQDYVSNPYFCNFFNWTPSSSSLYLLLTW